jgi:Protein of unknown function (DUF1838)
MTPVTDDSQHTAIDGVSRRSLLAWTGAAAAGALAAALPGRAAGASASAAPTVPTGVPVEMDARGVELYMKLHATSGDGQVPWYYTGRIYAVQEAKPPRHLFNLEGTEIYWVRRKSESEWESYSSTLTFYRDARTGEYFDSYQNPFTGKTLSVRPNVLRSNKLATFSPRGNGAIPWLAEAHQSGDNVWLVTSRYALSMPQPWIEIQTMFGQAAALADPRQQRPPTMFSSSYLAPYLAWMEMGDTPGHLLWHSSGSKLASYDDIPPGYMQRARRMQPVHFEAPAGA